MPDYSKLLNDSAPSAEVAAAINAEQAISCDATGGNMKARVNLGALKVEAAAGRHGIEGTFEMDSGGIGYKGKIQDAPLNVQNVGQKAVLACEKIKSNLGTLSNVLLKPGMKP